MKRALVIGNSRQTTELKTIIPLANYQTIATTAYGIEGLRLLHRVEPDIVIMTWSILGLTAFDLLQNLMTQRLCPVIVVISQEDTNALAEIINLNADYVLVQPLRAFDLITAVHYVEYHFSQERQTHKMISRLENDIKMRKILYQAILKIIQKKGYDEKTAYRKMQQYAMTNRKTLYAVASEILKENWLPE